MIIEVTSVSGDPIWVNADRIMYFNFYEPKKDEMPNDNKKAFICLGERYLIVATSPDELMEKIEACYE